MSWEQKPKPFKYKETSFDGDFESFIGAWTIESGVCDALVDSFDDKKAVFDEKRGYHRMVNKHLPKQAHDSYMQSLHKCVDLYTKKYPWANTKHTVDWFISQPYNVQKYDAGSCYKVWHIEDPGPREGKLQRHLTFMTYLNDIEEGGETEFLYQDLDVKPQKGLTLIWPAGWTHPHRGRPAPAETKYIVTGWCTYKHRC